MRALMTDDPGFPNSRFTVTGNGGVVYGTFDTVEEVVEAVKSRADGECTIRFGIDETIDGPAADEIRDRIAAL